MKMNSKVALVTGGAGFIGSNLVQELVGRGYRVVILDNLSTGRMENIEPLSGNENVKFIRGSVTNLSFLTWRDIKLLSRCSPSQIN